MKPLVDDSPDVVIVVDDDPSICDSLSRLVRSVGLRAQTFQSVDAFFRSKLPDVPCCLIVDVRLPGSSGLDLQSELKKSGRSIPIVFMSGHGDVPMTVQAMKAGAVDFLIKPFREQDMLDAIQAGLENDRKRRKLQSALSALHSRFAALTTREREIMSLATEGLMNKQIAGVLGITEVTVKVHRANVMKKMEAASFADLVRMARELNVDYDRAQSDPNLPIGRT
jgi:FixJ family two-component response regulator